jgi:arylsulfatase A-like enzyme/glycosyltransferase involved in cell wall biosynthesis
MRIALVIHGFPPANMAGSEVYTYNLAMELAKRHEVFVFHRTADTERPEYEIQKFEFHGLHITTINNNFRNCPDFSWTYRNDEIGTRFGAFLDETRPDVVHFHHLTCLSTTCVEEAKKRAIPVLYTLHDFWLICQRGQLLTRELDICEGPSDGACAECLAGQLAMKGPAAKAAGALKKTIPSLRGGSRAKELLRKVFLLSSKAVQKGADSGAEEIRKRSEHISHICSLIDCFIAPSKFLLQKYVDNGIEREKIRYSDYGFDRSLFRGISRKPSEKIRFGYIGSWIPSKGVHVLIKAFNRVTDKNASLTIYGEESPFHGYRDYGKGLRDLVKNPSIRLAGPYDNKDVGRILAGIDVLVVPSIWYENSPLTIHEAYLAGVPVIASDIGGMAEYVSEGAGGLNFKVGDDEDLYRQIKRVIDDPVLLERMRESIPAVKGIDENAREMEEIYAEVRAPAEREGFDFIRHLYDAEVKKSGRGYTECAYTAFKQKEMVNVSAFSVGGEERRVLFSHPAIRVGEASTTVAFRGITPQKGDTLVFGIGINEEAWDKPGDGVEFKVIVLTEDEERSLYKKYIDPKANNEDRRWFDESIDLAGLEGLKIELLLKTSAGPRNDPEYDWAGWSGPCIKGASGEVRHDFMEELKKAFIIRFEREDPKREDVFYLGDDARQVLCIEKGTELVFRGVSVPAGARLLMGVGARGGPRGIRLGGGLEVAVSTGEKKEVIFSKNALLALSKRLTKNSWHDVELDLSRFGGEELDFHFSNGSGKLMGLGPLKIRTEKKKKTARRSISHTNVLIITLDAVRADHMGFMGHKTVKTPCMDRLAGEGVVFRNHFAQSHITIPSHMSMLTSKFPRTIRTLDNYQYNLPPIETIASRLEKAGFRTSAIVSTALLNPQWCHGIERGFTDYFPVLGMERAASQGLNILGDWITDNSDRPFFSWIHLFDAHFPYQAPKPFFGMYTGNAREKVELGSVHLHAQTEAWLKQKGITDLSLPAAEYGAEITYLDSELGRLFRKMEALGVLDNTLIMITSDHGEYLGERGNYFCHVGLHDETMRIPLLMRLPGSLPAGRVVDGMTMNLDLAPTALEVLGLSADDMEGKSLLPLVEGKTEDVHEYVVDEGAHGAQIAMRTKKWKYIKTLEDVSYSANFQRKKGEVELFDLENDPAEEKNVAKENPETAARFSAMVDDWLKARSGGEKAEQIEADEETKKKLEALGYM